MTKLFAQSMTGVRGCDKHGEIPISLQSASIHCTHVMLSTEKVLLQRVDSKGYYRLLCGCLSNLRIQVSQITIRCAWWLHLVELDVSPKEQTLSGYGHYT